MVKKRQPATPGRSNDGPAYQASYADDGYRSPKVILRGHRLARLLRELAEADKPQSALARKYGVSQPRISQINTEHRERIEAIRADIDNEFAGLWIADKSNRLEYYQADLESINEKLAEFAELNEDAYAWIRLRDKLLRAAAEELGQIPNKMTVKSSVEGKYKFEGVDDADVT